MSRRCDCCRRGSTKGASRSHSKVKTLKRQHINLQIRKIDGLRVKICTACLRTFSKQDRLKEKASQKLNS